MRSPLGFFSLCLHLTTNFILYHIFCFISPFYSCLLLQLFFLTSVTEKNKKFQLYLYIIILILYRHLNTNAGFNSTCYQSPPPGTPPGICNFFLTWRSIPHPRASRKRQFPTPGTPHRPQIRCFVFKIDFRTKGQPDVLTTT